MIKFSNIVISTLMLMSVTDAGSYFISHDDICEGTQRHQCTNDYNSVRNLQIALTRDKKIDVELKADGKWGESTKKAVIAFQEAYHLSPADGWVGESTKIKLDQISRKIKFPKDKQVQHLSLMTDAEKRWNFDEFKRRVNTYNPHISAVPKVAKIPSVPKVVKVAKVTPVETKKSVKIKKKNTPKKLTNKIKKGYFLKHEDICEKTETHTCKNDFNTVRNLQIALSRDTKTDLKLKADGKWGEGTKKAVIAFQKAYNLLPADGWVGRSTKEKLDEISRKIKFPKDKKVAHIALMKSGKFSDYTSFRKNVNLRKSYKVFQDKKLLAKATGRNTKLKIDVSEQRIRLYVNNKVALDSPCTTGAKRKFEPNTKTYRDKHTPLGTFKITEKVAAKKSTIFGEMYRNGKKVYHGDRRKYRGPKAKYVGHTMHNWMRLTSGGIGLHASKYIKRYPGSNGCVRLPFKVARTIFSKVKRGTKVTVMN